MIDSSENELPLIGEDRFANSLFDYLKKLYPPVHTDTLEVCICNATDTILKSLVMNVFSLESRLLSVRLITSGAYGCASYVQNTDSYIRGLQGNEFPVVSGLLLHYYISRTLEERSISNSDNLLKIRDRLAVILTRIVLGNRESIASNISAVYRVILNEQASIPLCATSEDPSKLGMAISFVSHVADSSEND